VADLDKAVPILIQNPQAGKGGNFGGNGPSVGVREAGEDERSTSTLNVQLQTRVCAQRATVLLFKV